MRGGVATRFMRPAQYRARDLGRAAQATLTGTSGS